MLFVCASCSTQPDNVEVTPDPTINKETIAPTEVVNEVNNDPLKVLFLNVAKGDSALVSYQDKNYLIDTGSSKSLPVLVKALIDNNIEKIDAVYITHIHNDHTGGLAGLFELFEVEDVYFPEITDYDEDGYNCVISICEQYNQTLTRVNAGDIHYLSDDNNVNFEIIGPVTHCEDENDNSLVMYLNYYSRNILFTGDMRFEEEETLINNGTLKRTNILKAGHHGNDDASSKAFVDIINPEYVVFSTDKDVLDKDSNYRALYLANKAENAYITDDFPVGVGFTLINNEILFDNIEISSEANTNNIEIATIDYKAEVVSIKNNSDNIVDLSNWWIYAKEEKEIYFIPDGTIINPEQVITISSGSSPPQADLFWTSDNIWKKDDKCTLYNNSGVVEAKYSLEDK